MPQITRGKAQLSTQVRADLLDHFRKYALGRGETLSAALERAMTREMAYPPAAPPLTPLPDAGAPAPVAKPRAGRSSKAIDKTR